MKEIKETGITLIALVITIIVMLILVAVTVNIAINGGLFNYAKTAKAETITARDEEQKLGNLTTGLGTDELIAIYTKENPDLKKLKQYFANGFRTVIDRTQTGFKHGVEPFPYADSISAEEVLYNLMIEPENGEFIICNGRIYKLTIDYSTEALNVTNIEPLNEQEVLVYNIYNKSYVIFTPSANQTWYQWASENSESDITIDRDRGLTLKQLIISVNGSEDDTIKYEDDPGFVAPYYLWKVISNNKQSSSSQINPGAVYRYCQ